MKVVALGRTKLLYDSIKFLHKKGIQIALIGTCQEAPEYDVGSLDFQELANNIGAEFFCDVNINSKERIEQIKKLKPTIAISVNWLNIISKDVIDIFPNGILNCHAGDLPRYRGNAVANWAIINKENKIVVSIHKMDLGLDTGDIILQKALPINESTKIGEIYKTFEEIVPEMFYESIIGLSNGSIIPTPQDKDPLKSLRCYPRIYSDSYLNWDQSAEYLNAIVRASSEPFSGAYTYFNGSKLIVLSSHVEKFKTPSVYVNGQVLWKIKDTGEVGVATAKEILVLEKVKLEDGSIVRPTEIIKSLRTRLGINSHDEIYLLNKKVKELEECLKRVCRSIDKF